MDQNFCYTEIRLILYFSGEMPSRGGYGWFSKRDVDSHLSILIEAYIRFDRISPIHDRPVGRLSIPGWISDGMRFGAEGV